MAWNKQIKGILVSHRHFGSHYVCIYQVEPRLYAVEIDGRRLPARHDGMDKARAHSEMIVKSYLKTDALRGTISLGEDGHGQTLRGEL